MKRRLLISMLAIAASGYAGDACELCGRWRSNAERTLPGMEQSPLLSDRQRQFFRSDFYGKLVVETRANDTRAYFPDESPDDVAWETWEILSRAGDTLTIRSSLVGETLVRDVRLHGDCYEVLQPNLGFSEWFCREP